MTQAVAQGGEAATGQSAIDEIIVTANKREQSLQDTAMSISALPGETIDKRDLVGMGDYLPPCLVSTCRIAVLVKTVCNTWYFFNTSK